MKLKWEILGIWGGLGKEKEQGEVQINRVSEQIKCILCFMEISSGNPYLYNYYALIKIIKMFFLNISMVSIK